jgi:hypothetical protein
VSERSERTDVTVPATFDPHGRTEVCRTDVTVPATFDPHGGTEVWR